MGLLRPRTDWKLSGKPIGWVVPNGMRKAEAMKLWANAREIADAVIKEFEAQGIVPAAVVPDSDDEIAKEALREACVLALGPGDRRTKLMAAYTVLKFTKAPPVQCYATALTTMSARLPWPPA